MTEEICVCSHKFDRHFVGAPSSDRCTLCLLSDKNYWHTFKLDNLRFIEDLAKEKGLV